MKVELVTTLKRQATAIIKELNQKHEPILITEHGKPAAYLVDVQSYEKSAKRMTLLEGLARGEAAVQDGRIIPQEEAKARMARWLK